MLWERELADAVRAPATAPRCRRRLRRAPCSPERSVARRADARPRPRNAPAAVVRLAATPASPPSFGSRVALLGAGGATCFGACRRKRNGFTLIGQDALAAVDLDQVDVEMDRVDGDQEARMHEVIANAPAGAQRWPCRTTTYRVGDDGRLAFDTSSESPAWHAGDLDGDVIAHRIVRQRWLH